MRLEQTEQGFSLSVDQREIFRHTKAAPFITVGVGKASYGMKRGSFKSRETVKDRAQLSEFSVTPSVNGYKVKFSDATKAYQLNMIIEKTNDRLELSFEASGQPFNRFWVNFKGSRDEHIYGCGEQFTHFDLKGQKVRIWVAEHQSLKRMISKVIRRKLLFKKTTSIMAFKKYETYYAQPTFISSRKMFVHVVSDAYMDFDFRQKDINQLMIRSIREKIIIGVNDSYPALLQNISNILGRQPKLPDWVYDGMILGIQGGTDTLIKKVDNAINAGIKVSGVWCQDWEGRRITAFGKQLMWNWEWDMELYPNLDKEINNLNKRGIRFLGYINPFLAVEGKLYKEASSNGYTIKNKDGQDYMVTITTFPAAMLDLTNPQAVTWIKSIIKKNMIELGLSGWMADFGEYLPVDAVLYSKEDPELIHNTWPALWAKVNREAISEAGKLGEVFFFTRAGHTKSIKYSTFMWNGDQHVDWSLDDGLASVIPATLSLAMSGFGLCHSDIGGYTTIFDMKRSKELLLRWCELCTFSPMMRTHEGNRSDDNVQFDADSETLKHFARISRIYCHLAPYIKDCVNENADYGTPVMRPLFMHYEEDKTYDIKYQYLLGRDLLVAPVYKESASNCSVYLPNDKWIHIWTHREYEGGTFEIEAPIGYPPVFYRKDSPYSKIFETVKSI